MTLCVIWQVIARAGGIASTFTDEVARFMFIWAGLIGAAYGHGQKRHLAIDLFTRHLTGQKQLYSQCLIHFLVIAFAGIVMIYGGGALTYGVYLSGQHSSTLQLPMWIVYIILPMSGVGIAFYSIYDLYEQFTASGTTKTDTSQHQHDALV